MRFGEFALADALGVRLAHSLRLAGSVLRKGHELVAADLSRLSEAGIHAVTGARIDTDELDEDAAAAGAAGLLAGHGLRAQPAARGRSNIKAAAAGLLCVDAPCIDRLNAIDESLTVGTLPPFALVRAGEVAATVKAIPFAVPRQVLSAWRETSAGRAAMSLAPLRPKRAALLATRGAMTTDSMLSKTAAVTGARLAALGSKLAVELRPRHRVEEVAAALREALDAGAEIILIAGASVSKDRADTVPAAVVAAGGEILHFGMPVEPGNMLLYARIGAVPVLNLPGCARSRRMNGLDWVLRRLLAELPLSGRDIMAMGVGGLIASGAEGGPEDEVEPEPAPHHAARPARIAALVLAGGGGASLACDDEGVPAVRRAVDKALGSRCVQVLVVSGQDAAALEDALAGCEVSIAHNAHHESGIASSLGCGLRALARDIDGALVMLGDMPALRGEHLDRLIAAFDAAAPAIVAPARAGRRGNPVLWPRRYFPELLALTGMAGARRLLTLHAENLLLVPVEDDTIFVAPHA